MIDWLVDWLIDWWIIVLILLYKGPWRSAVQCREINCQSWPVTSLCPQLAHSTLLFNHFWSNSVLCTISVLLSYIILGRKEPNINHKYLVEFGEWSSHVWLTFVSLFLILCACDHFCFLLLTGLTKCCKRKSCWCITLWNLKIKYLMKGTIHQL